MFTTSLEALANSKRHVDWGNGESYRMIVADDKMGFTVCHTIVRAGTRSLLHYRNHLEACYCVAGSGAVEELDGTRHIIVPGTIYVLDQHDKHYLEADSRGDMVLVSVFNPPLVGTEVHDLDDPEGSAY